MGYAYYEIDTPEGKPMKRGYSVTCKCHQRGCKESIDRGLAYLCYSCTWYFCGDHLYLSMEEFDCALGAGNQVCNNCFNKHLEQVSDDDGE